MSISYVIEWKSRVNGRAGRGTKRFDLEEAQRLAEELNREYPAIHHEPAQAGLAVETVSASADESDPAEQAAPDVPRVNHSPDHAFSLE